MITEIGNYILDIDADRTREYYRKAKTVSEKCSCDGCLNFEKAADVLPRDVVDMFGALGVDPKKARECYACCKNGDGTVLYGGWYHVCGKILTGESAWKKTGPDTSAWDESGAFFVAPGFGVSFQNEIDLPDEDFPLPVIQLEISAAIPWVLDKENTYFDR